MPAVSPSPCFTWGEWGTSYCFQLSLVIAGVSEFVHAGEGQNLRPWAGETRAVGRTGRGVGPSPCCPGPVRGVAGVGTVRRAAMASCRSRSLAPVQAAPVPAAGVCPRPAPTSFNSGLGRVVRRGWRGGRRAPGAARRQRPAAGKTKGSHVLRAARLPGAPGESARPRPAGARPRGGGCWWGGTCRVRDGVF